MLTLLSLTAILVPSSHAVSTITTITLPASVTGTTVLAASTVTPSISPQLTDPSQFIPSILNSTNYHRYLYSAPFLSYNTSLASYAQAYSSNCIWQHNPDLSNSHFGENLARGYADVVSAVDAWGNEASLFDYGNLNSSDLPTGSGGYTGFSEQTGHFTQLVWKSTVSVGCGWTDCNGKNGLQGVMLVCNYSPAGNVLAGNGESGQGGENMFFLQNVGTERKGGGSGYNETAGAEGVRAGSGENATATGAGSGPTTSAVGVALRPGWEGARGGGKEGLVALGVLLAAFGVGLGLI